MHVSLIQASSCAKARFLDRDHAEYQFDQPFLHISMEEEELPEIQDKYKSVPDERGTFYFKVDDLRADFMYHDPNNEKGYAGRTFMIDMEDGSTVSVTGPWSSRSSIFNLYVPERYHVIECSFYDVRREDGRVSGIGYSGHMLVNVVRDMMPDGFRIVRDTWTDYRRNEIAYEVWHDGCTQVAVVTLNDGQQKHIEKVVGWEQFRPNWADDYRFGKDKEVVDVKYYDDPFSIPVLPSDS